MHASQLSVQQFTQRYDVPGLPVVIQGAQAGWKAGSAWATAGGSSSSEDSRDPHGELLIAHGNTRFDVGSYQMTLGDYVKYARQVCDDQLLLLFDPLAFDKAPGLAGDWRTPSYFSNDLLACLGATRPHHR